MNSTLVYNQEDRLLPWLAARAGGGVFGPEARAIGLERDGALVAVVAFDDFSPCDAQMHVAAEGSHWLNRSLLAAAFAYPFVQLGLRRVSCRMAASNTAALRFNAHLGFQREGHHPQALPGDDVISTGLLRRDCRFIAPQYRY